MNIFNKVYSFTKNESLIAKTSSYLSYKEINNVRLLERPHYISNKKGIAFLEAIDQKVLVDEKIATSEGLGIDRRIKYESQIVQERTYKNNIYKQVKDSIRVAKQKGILVPYDRCTRGKYVLIHFPFYNRTMELKGGKKYSDVYWWCGSYRNLSVYACGNKKNRIDDASSIDEPLWDPSGSKSSREFFDKIEDYILFNRSDYIEVEEEIFFDKLSGALHGGTIRGYKNHQYHGWYEMLLRCDYVERDKERITIFGSPVFVTYETEPGYGWYLVKSGMDKSYYQEWNGSWVEHYFKVESVMGMLFGRKYNLKKKVSSGFDYGYHIFEEEEVDKLWFTDKMSGLSKEEICQLDKDRGVRPNGMETVRSVCFTTREVRKSVSNEERFVLW